MIYQFSQTQAALLARLRPFACNTSSLLRSLQADRSEASPLAQAAAALQLLEGVGTTHRISAGLIADVDTAMDAEGIRQWALPDAAGTASGKKGRNGGG